MRLKKIILRQPTHVSPREFPNNRRDPRNLRGVKARDAQSRRDDTSRADTGRIDDRHATARHAYYRRPVCHKPIQTEGSDTC